MLYIHLAIILSALNVPLAVFGDTDVVGLNYSNYFFGLAFVIVFVWGMCAHHTGQVPFYYILLLNADTKW